MAAACDLPRCGRRRIDSVEVVVEGAGWYEHHPTALVNDDGAA